MRKKLFKHERRCVKCGGPYDGEGWPKVTYVQQNGSCLARECRTCGYWWLERPLDDRKTDTN